MKKQITTIALIHCAIASQAQAPQAVPYQAIARNSSGTIVASAPVGLRFTIRDNSPSGTVLYTETHTPTTSDQGSFNVNIGQGSVVTGSFSTINWGVNAKYLQVELDVAGGTSYVDMGTQQLLSVPYALYAESAGGSSSWADSAGMIHNTNTTKRVGIGTNNPLARLHVADSSIVFTGPTTPGSTPATVPVTGNGSRLMWVPQNSALRAGFAYGTQWNADSIGAASVAMGNGPTATGTNAIALGHLARANANNATAIGDSATATGLWSTALGRHARATAQQSLVLGNNSAALTNRAFTIGNNSIADGLEAGFVIGNNSSSSGFNTFTVGSDNTAYGSNGFAIGMGNTTTGGMAMGWGSDAVNGSIAIGSNNHGTGTSCVALGYGVTASGSNSVAIGNSSTASGADNLALGYQTTSAGNVSTTMGYQTYASGFASTAMGWQTTASGDASIAGGINSQATGISSFAFGENSRAFGAYSVAIGQNSFADGGTASIAIGSATALDGAVALGVGALASGANSIALGHNTTTTGQHATSIGYMTTADGDYSVALGTYSSTGGTNGSFAIGDASWLTTGTLVTNTADNQMAMRFAGGYRLYSDANATIGAQLAPGSNSWSVISDKRRKENFRPIDGNKLLAKIEDMPITSWNYKQQDPKTFRHYGPMAQDFYAAFGNDGVGTVGNDTTINQADMAGITLAAVQALANKAEALAKENEALRKRMEVMGEKEKKYLSENDQLKAELNDIKSDLVRRLESLESNNRKNQTATR